MSMTVFIDGLTAEAAESVRGLLQQAYDRGFREALATTGKPEVAEGPPAPPVADPVAWEGATSTASEAKPAAVEWAGGAEDAEEADAADDAPVVRPILPHATVGTLRKRIFKTFDLERFDLDIVICRRGDRDRRQLKSTARLSLYAREER